MALVPGVGIFITIVLRLPAARIRRRQSATGRRPHLAHANAQDPSSNHLAKHANYLSPLWLYIFMSSLTHISLFSAYRN